MNVKSQSELDIGGHETCYFYNVYLESLIIIDFKQTRLLKNALSYTPKAVVVKVYKIARILSSFLRKHDITFWSSGGTTLGWLNIFSHHKKTIYHFRHS